MKNIYFIDLDKALIHSDAKLVVIDKDEPNKVIMKLDSHQEPMLKSYYKKHDLRVEYNGEKFYLSPELFDTIKFKKKNIKLNKIGISRREFNKDLTMDRMYFLLDNIKVDENDEIIVIASNTDNKEQIQDSINKISKKIKKPVFKTYIIKTFKDENEDFLAKKKATIVLEYMLGFKIKSNKITDKKQTECNNVAYYDEDQNDIDTLNNMQELFEMYLKNSDPIVKSMIVDLVNDTKKTLITKKLGSNEMNPFITKEFFLITPKRIKMFESYSTENQF